MDRRIIQGPLLIDSMHHSSLVPFHMMAGSALFQFTV